ncbi:MAG: shikimate dehydrogenase family protein [Candidatus Binataceae bacterium]
MNAARSNLQIDGATGAAVIYGDPVAHSASPAMHNAAYAALKMNRVYLAFRVLAPRLRSALDAIDSLGLAGANITVPHKESAARAIMGRRNAQLSAEAYALGAVNAIANRHGTLLGDNTDARGLEADLRALRCAPRGGTAIVIGAGGAAAAAVLALARLGAVRIVLANRTVKRAANLGRRITEAHRHTLQIDPCGLDALKDSKLMAEARVIVNASAMGLATRRFAPLAYGAAPAECLFYDLIYSAKPTAFLKPAIAAGRRTADGAGMLAAQGELSFQLFNGVAPPRGVMRAALMKYLGRK